MISLGTISSYGFNQYQVFSAIPEDTDRYAVIVESRPHYLLEGALRNVAFYLAPKGWGLLIIHAESESIRKLLNPLAMPHNASWYCIAMALAIHRQ